MAKCLSIRQPWVQLILAGFKDVENRSWSTAHRGPLLIHASRRVEWDLVAVFREEAARVDEFWPEDLPTGGIIGIATLVECAPTYASQWWEPGYIAWVLKDAMHIPLLPFKGRLGLFDVPDDLILQHLRDTCPEALAAFPTLGAG